MPSLKQLIDRRDAVGREIGEIDRDRAKIREFKQRVDHKLDKDHGPERERFLEKRRAELLKQEHELTREIKAARDREENLIKRILRKRREKAERSKLLFTSGPQAWGGSECVIDREVNPVAKRFGYPRTSAKRAASDPLTIANPGSDHSVLQVLASAADYGTFSGADFAYAVAKTLGISGYSTGNYTAYYIERGGHTFRVQILWAVVGHFNHVHVGLERIS